MKVNKESAESVREAISNTIKENENYEDNPERLQNPTLKNSMIQLMKIILLRNTNKF